MQGMKKGVLAFVLIGAMAVTGFTGCAQQAAPAPEAAPVAEEAKLTGEIHIDGSSTVFPITEAMAEEFLASNPDVKIPVGVSGTGGGFKKWLAKETDINDASRPIKDKEAEDAKAAGIDYVELKVAYDGLSVLVNKENTWVDSLTIEELNKLWNKDSTVKLWSDLNPAWPSEPIKFYAPGTDSGTFEYFTEAVNKEAGNIRPDFTGSEDDNVLVQGIAGDKNAIGFFGFAYYEENQDKLKLVKVNGIAPSFETIKSGTYAPLSRPLFMYVNKEALARPEVKTFLTFYLENAMEIVPQVGYVALPEDQYQEGLGKIK